MPRKHNSAAKRFKKVVEIFPQDRKTFWILKSVGNWPKEWAFVILLGLSSVILLGSWSLEQQHAAQGPVGANLPSWIAQLQNPST